MPADRDSRTDTGASTEVSGAAAEGSAGLYRTEPVLSKGNACVTCRKRRVKCDGAKPACSRCVKSAKSSGPDVVCTYDAAVPKKTTPRSRAAAKPVDKVAELAAELAELKRHLMNPQVFQQAPQVSAPDIFLQPNPSAPVFNYAAPDKFSPLDSYPTSRSSTSPSSLRPNEPQPCALQSVVGPGAYPLVDPLLDLSFLDTFSWALLPSLYPATLPSPALLDRLLTVFFTKEHLADGMISESRLRASMLLPRSDLRAPLEALLHALAATTGLMVGDGFFDGEEWQGGSGGRKYWAGGAGEGGLEKGDGAAAFSEYHAKRALDLIEPSFRSGRQLLQVVQTATLCIYCAYTAGRFTDIWGLVGTASRLAILAGLNNIRPIGRIGATLSDKALIPPPKDDDEVRERQITWWSVFSSDRMTNAASDWAHTIHEQNITTMLPEPKGSGGWHDTPLTSPLCIANPSFLLANPPALVGTYQLYTKSLVLLGRVCNFMQTAPEPIGSGYPMEHEVDLRQTTDFRRLEGTVVHFRDSLPRDLQWSHVLRSTGRLDNRLLLAYSLVHVVMILLHEPFCTESAAVNDHSVSKCGDAAGAILASVYELAGSSFEIGLLASFVNWTWSVAGRTLVRAIAFANRRQDFCEAERLTLDVQALIAAMQANRSPVGATCARMLSALLSNPSQVLPASDPYTYDTIPRHVAVSGVWDIVDDSPQAVEVGEGLEELEELARKVVEDAEREAGGWM